MKKRTFIVIGCTLLIGKLFGVSVSLTGSATDLQDAVGDPAQNGTLAFLVVDTDDSAGIDFVEGSFSSGSLMSSSNAFLVSQGAATFDSFAGSTTFSFSDETADSPEISVGDEIYAAWFPTLTSSATTLSVGDAYGISRTTGWTIDSDPFSGTLAETTGGAANLSVNAIPEPSAYATILGLLGFGYAVFCRRRRSSSRE